jgi:hypothetical protein
MHDLVHCIRKGLIVPGSHVSGSMRWTSTRTGEETCSIGYEANLIDPMAAWVRLHYTTTRNLNGEKVPFHYRIQLETTQPHFGGLRWWFVCPLSGRRAQVLYLPPVGGTTFASRHQLRSIRGENPGRLRHRVINCAQHSLRKPSIQFLAKGIGVPSQGIVPPPEFPCGIDRCAPPTCRLPLHLSKCT